MEARIFAATETAPFRLTLLVSGILSLFGVLSTLVH